MLLPWLRLPPGAGASMFSLRSWRPSLMVGCCSSNPSTTKSASSSSSSSSSPSFLPLLPSPLTYSLPLRPLTSSLATPSRFSAAAAAEPDTASELPFIAEGVAAVTAAVPLLVAVVPLLVSAVTLLEDFPVTTLESASVATPSTEAAANAARAVGEDAAAGAAGPASTFAVFGARWGEAVEVTAAAVPSEAEGGDFLLLGDDGFAERARGTAGNDAGGGVDFALRRPPFTRLVPERVEGGLALGILRPERARER